MCKAVDEPGGPRRCSGDARARAEQSHRQVEGLLSRREELESVLDEGRTYRSESAFRAALNNRINSVAAATGVDQQDLARRFAIQQFVSRLFDSDPQRWLLTGGTALQFRTATESRATLDLDLAVTGTINDIEHALQEGSRRRGGEHGDFTVTVAPTDGGDGVGSFTGKITYLLNGRRFSVAKLDVVVGRHFPFAPDVMTPEPVVGIDDLRPMAAVRAYPVASHLADKISAMYEWHGGAGTTPSSRSHDLGDIAILARCASVDAQELKAAIEGEELRRGVSIPYPLRLPSENWRETYPARVRESGLPAALCDADAALGLADRFVGAVASGRVVRGRWDPHLCRWAS